MQREEKLRAVRAAIGKEAFKKNNEYVFSCQNPNGCAGKHHNAKLSVNIESESFNCWVCGWSGKSLFGILRVGNKDTLTKYTRYKKGNTHVEEEVSDYVIPNLPVEFHSLASSDLDLHGAAARRYLYSRGIEERDILTYKLGFCEAGEYRFRVIIPSFDRDGALNFFVGRTFYDNAGVSYKHGIFDKDIIFNDYMMDWEAPITIVEGPIDMIKAGMNSIPLQGSELSEHSLLFEKIVTSRVPVYMALDVDARKKQIKHIKKLLSYGVEVFHIPVENLGASDVGEMTKEQFQIAKSNAKRISGDIDLLRMRAA